MGTDRARLLLHPVRMRVVIALSADALTTRDLQRVMPEVPQASLYRAIAQLKDAGVIEIVSSERRGGAMERTYRTVAQAAMMTNEEFTSGTPEEFLATLQAFADHLVATSSRFVGSREDGSWRDEFLSVRNGGTWLTAAECDELGEDLAALYAKYEDKPRRDGALPYSLNVAMIPDAPVARDGQAAEVARDAR
ncbi:MAG: helix-turn-helix domain-containing protein [Demequina sp.]|uniref:helix-turn-helix domain-containing protein n=1 Tax=Demequina sp. TaxID=2050685 RepID=UPI003A83C2D2